jgi:hypothetical protein
MNMKLSTVLLLAGLLAFTTWRAAFAQVPPQSAGKIKGVLTYYFNSTQGSKADVGSEIWLVEGRLEIPEDAIVMGGVNELVVGSRGTPVKDMPTYKIIKRTRADGSGNFEIPDVAVGTYTLILKSNHAVGRGLRDVAGKLRRTTINIKAGETVDASLDFGVSVL